jgi:hypothetical protein
VYDGLLPPFAATACRELPARSVRAGRLAVLPPETWLHGHAPPPRCWTALPPEIWVRGRAPHQEDPLTRR